MEKTVTEIKEMMRSKEYNDTYGRFGYVFCEATQDLFNFGIDVGERVLSVIKEFPDTEKLLELFFIRLEQIRQYTEKEFLSETQIEEFGDLIKKAVWNPEISYQQAGRFIIESIMQNENNNIMVYAISGRTMEYLKNKVEKEKEYYDSL